MNYFGMFFSFMIPGLILGAMAVAVFGEKKRAFAPNAKKRRDGAAESGRNKLYICDLAAELREDAA
ncbi:MAG: hypothetical protein PHC80_05195 [Eubacteriales bacterium]|nr:hypothetical protein [Eubacteriales bacterium]